MELLPVRYVLHKPEYTQKCSLRVYLITPWYNDKKYVINSMQQCPSSVADSRLVDQEIRRLLCNPKIRELPYSQEPATGSYLKLTESGSRIHSLLVKDSC
jgi:hypothetical protein